MEVVDKAFQTSTREQTKGMGFMKKWGTHLQGMGKLWIKCQKLENNFY